MMIIIFPPVVLNLAINNLSYIGSYSVNAAADFIKQKSATSLLPGYTTVLSPICTPPDPMYLNSLTHKTSKVYLSRIRFSRTSPWIWPSMVH